MGKEYSIFRKYSTLDQAKQIESLLSKEGIESIIADNAPTIDSTFGASPLNNEIEIRIKQIDFEKAEKILEKQAQNLITEVANDYYLFEFTNEELYEILLKSDEWSEFDYTLSQQILRDRGKSINTELLNSLKTERLKQLSKPEENQKSWIFAGYFFSIIGGMLGLIIGYFLWTSKKTLPNGQKVYSYSEKDRKQGKYIFYIGLVVFPTSFLIRLAMQL
ncbi:hypothetical protein D1816_01985 [Aquimarina sp. AD10]|uniref:DUF2007 domain-containing protein n=1 Tax=Aquimarina sp. AD10 TaxID=1714849 RepID=UPI000E4F9764|nr:DUF2007 domain-containing protein [Aquimarina sp. AD10]AXT59167.1 hypothetical protein D1816_01985 [Aquimarina sp. AD10]RKM93874.1 hypothetical protein D7033_19010 [Aquimarina sp. AD10]